MSLVDVEKWEAAADQMVANFPYDNDGIRVEEAGNDATLGPCQLWVNLP